MFNILSPKNLPLVIFCAWAIVGFLIVRITVEKGGMSFVEIRWSKIGNTASLHIARIIGFTELTKDSQDVLVDTLNVNENKAPVQISEESDDTESDDLPIIRNNYIKGNTSKLNESIVAASEVESNTPEPTVKKEKPAAKKENTPEKSPKTSPASPRVVSPMNTAPAVKNN